MPWTPAGCQIAGMSMLIARVAALVALLTSPLAAASAQVAVSGQRPPQDPSPGDGWNSPDALDLMQRAAARRASVRAAAGAGANQDGVRYTIRAEGQIHYTLEFAGEARVVRADQVAVDVDWRPPDFSRQTIVGRRSEGRLPQTITYHIDHLALLLDNYRGTIRLGQGDEVPGAPHPAHAGFLGLYDYRVADSLSVRTAAGEQRLAEIEVRPKQPGLPGVVGSLFVDRDSGDLARIRLSFTETAYRDPSLERISIDLRGAVWAGGHWLPESQQVEIIRGHAWLGFPVKTRIHVNFRVLSAEVGSVDRAGPALAGHTIVSAVPSRLELHADWTRPLHLTMDAIQPLTEAELNWYRSDALRLLRGRHLTGLNRFRPWLPAVSSGIRARRGEGFFLGAGVEWRPTDAARLTALPGFAAGLDRPEAALDFGRLVGVWEVSLSAAVNRTQDLGRPVRLGGGPALFGESPTAGLLKSLSLLVGGDDFEDPYYTSGATLTASRPVGPAGTQAVVTISGSVAGHRPARLVWGEGWPGGGMSRAVRKADRGTQADLAAGVRWDLGSYAGASWDLSATVGGRYWIPTSSIDSADQGTAPDPPKVLAAGEVGLRGVREPIRGRPGWTLSASVGATGVAAPQHLYLLGGRGTLPGYNFRDWGGDRFALIAAEVSQDIAWPWVRLHAGVASGTAAQSGAGARAAAGRFGVDESGGPRASGWVGLGLFYDLARIEAARPFEGLEGGHLEVWRLMVSVAPFVRGIL